MPDLEINCVQCRKVFTFGEREQETFYRRNQPQPQRCRECRPSRRKSAQPPIANENQRFAIVCDRCGKGDQVPFAPKVGRAVLCGSCYDAGRVKKQ